MKIKVFIERTDEKKILNVKTVNEIFEQTKIPRNTVLITRNNELIMEDEKLNENDEIRLLSVISGG